MFPGEEHGESVPPGSGSQRSCDGSSTSDNVESNLDAMEINQTNQSTTSGKAMGNDGRENTNCDQDFTSTSSSLKGAPGADPAKSGTDNTCGDQVKTEPANASGNEGGTDDHVRADISNNAIGDTDANGGDHTTDKSLPPNQNAMCLESSVPIDPEQDPHKQFFPGTDFNVPFPPPPTKAVLPKYVVRPGPVPPPPKYVLTEFGTHHALDRLVWMNVFHFLTGAELAWCMRVCKTWNRWCLECQQWHSIDLQGARIKQNHLMGVVRRQPRSLNLRDAVISRKQFVWLIARLPHLKSLNLCNNTWATVNGLCSSICPLLECLDLSWVDGIWNDCIRDLVSPPSDHRPGVDESASRLRCCAELSLAGTNITDQAMEVIAEYMSRLAKLDLSFCTGITEKTLCILSDDNALTKHTIVELKLCCVNRLDNGCFKALAALPNLKMVDLSQCRQISAEGYQKFLEIAKHKNFVVTRDLQFNLRIKAH